MLKPLLRRWRTRLILIVLALAVAGGLGYYGYTRVMAFFTARFYRDSYTPTEIEAKALGRYPAAFHLQNVPWYSTEAPYCAATSLRMIAAQRGTPASLGEVSFLMGFTYGATSEGGTFSPYTDPETGYIIAAPYLGLTRSYYVTNDPALYLQALRYYLSKGYAVRVPLDMAVLYGGRGPIPHSELLVGYSEEGFTYYETVCAAGAPCQAADRRAGEAGLPLKEELLLKAVESQSGLFQYPWRYALTIFDEGPTATNLKTVLRRNGALLIGGAKYGPSQGADAVDAAARAIERPGLFANRQPLVEGLRNAALTRQDNAALLRERFPGDPTVVQAAEALSNAALAYQRALQLLNSSPAQAASALRTAAAAEREAGRLLVNRNP